MKFRAIFAGLLICAGLSVISYPWLRAWYFERQKNNALEQWLNAPAYDVMEDFPPKEEEPEETGEMILPTEEDTSRPYDSTYVTSLMESVLYIDSIGLRSPVLPEATAKNLDFAICRLAGSVGPGESGNYCLAGHKSRIYGRHFNRLKEISIGDVITVETKQTVYHYEVVNTFIVMPEDIWTLENNLEKKEISLITCDYTQQPVGRFIVRGELAEEVQRP